MSPLFLANWSQINRAFCAFCWMAALVLAVVILGVTTGTSTVSSAGRSAQAGPAVGPGVVQLHRHP